MKPQQAFPIVGVGASAGGIEAMEGFFRGIPVDPGLSVVVVTHLNPERESILHEIISRYTNLTVEIAADAARVAPNCVYVLPADSILTIEGGHLKIQRPEAAHRERKPIDIFFSALARDQGERAVGVVLSGADGDGALGIKAIKERGGLTLAQIADGHGPSYSSMPESAIATGFVDLAVPVEQMGERLVEFGRSLNGVTETDASQADGDKAMDRARLEIYAILRNQVGHDFGGYKTKTFVRRVQRRMQILRLALVDAYLEQLRQDSTEVNALFRDLLINVTNFFRDADAFEALAVTVIPKLFEDRDANETVRVWVPGCATGEEVYSIAILIREHLGKLTTAPRVQIFATDIDENALAVARAGRYPEALLDSVSAERRRRFFVPDGGSYVMSKEVRDLCTFSPHSVIRDPPFSRIDLISCRNLLIYFGADVQNDVIPTFHYALRPGGYLFLGTSENVSQFNELFAPVERKQRIFRRREGAAARMRLTPLIGGPQATARGSDPQARKTGLNGIALRQLVETQVQERFAPAHVVTNREGDIVYYSTKTGKYLEPAAGIPSRQVLNLARKGLRLELRASLREAAETGLPTRRDGLTVESDDGRIQIVNLFVEPVAQSDGAEPLFLILFLDQGPMLSREDAFTRARISTDGAELHLERELRDTRERLQSLVEEYETALEELKSANEELVSVNEELQSTNEEMEASKEELQSLNEELHTVNAELGGKVDALDRANADLRNLFESTQVATVFLDQDLVIRSFTPAVGQVFNILPSDHGRPLTDLSSRLSLPTLRDDIRAVLSDGHAIERNVAQDGDRAHFLVRLAPYRDTDQLIEGVVVTFVDVTSLARAEAHHRTLIAELNHRVKNMLTIVVSIAEQTDAAATSREDFKSAFIARLHAMSRAYALLSRENWTEASIDEIVRQEMEPFGLGRVDFSGPNVRLKPKQALSLGMVLHELITNAGKYGALSASEGRVSLIWTKTRSETGDQLAVTWREYDGPSVERPNRRGFGLKLVERETAYNLGGGASVDFATEGLRAELKFPLPADET